jgi:tetratricopeptide (TPR) repeat protein
MSLIRRTVTRWCSQHAWLLTSLLMIGCATPSLLMLGDRSSRDLARTLSKPPPEPLKVKANTSGLTFLERENEEVRDRFRGHLESLVRDEHFSTARTWVHRYPEVALEVLRSSALESPDDPTLAIVAAGYDELIREGKLGSMAFGWSELIRNRQSGMREHQPYVDARKKTLQFLEQGEVELAVEVPLVALAEPLEPPLKIDARRLHATAHFLTGRTGEAIRALEEGIELATKHDPREGAELSLWLSDAYRREERHAEATQAWQRAVLAGGELLARRQPIRDPNFWDRASFLRPVDQTWPQAVEPALWTASGLTHSRNLPNHYGTPGGDLPSFDPRLVDVAVWTCIGQWRLDRGEADAALVALKKSETLANDRQLGDQVRLCQARAMYQLEQIGAATAILVGLSQSETEAVARASTALLGSIKLQTGHSTLGLRMLKRALDSDVEWPGRAEAEADLGLAWLMAGDETQGLRWLQTARRRFESAGDYESLARTLYNEREYWKSTKQQKKASEPAEQLAALEKRGEATLR